MLSPIRDSDRLTVCMLKFALESNIPHLVIEARFSYYGIGSKKLSKGFNAYIYAAIGRSFLNDGKHSNSAFSIQ